MREVVSPKAKTEGENLGQRLPLSQPARLTAPLTRGACEYLPLMGNKKEFTTPIISSAWHFLD